jgi:DNA-binding NtrC family response regulator
MAGALLDGRRADMRLRVDGRPVLAALRGPAGGDRLIELRDLEAFDWRRGGGSGRIGPARTRPDFEVQRRLSPALHRVLSRGERAMRIGARVLVRGESGVGKSEIARFLHGSVADADAPFEAVNCALGEPELERRLFGREGALRGAEGGTLFLDDLAEMPPALQARLIGWLEDDEGYGEGPGAAARRPRVIAATNVDLRAAAAGRRFRADLYYRLAVATLAVPPLRDMPEIVPHLARRFLRTINQRRETPVILPDRLMALLEDYAFPGNIRELLNLVQRAAIFVEDAEDMEELLAELMLPADDPPAPGEAGAALDLRAETRRFERRLIDRAIRVHGSKRAAARALGVDIGTIVRKTAREKAAADQSPPSGRNSGETA